MTTEKYIHPFDLESNVGVGLDLPLVPSNNSFFKVNYTTEDQAKANLRNLILTNKGERVMLPQFGCDIKRMIFEQEPEEKIIDNIENAIDEWLPYINIIELLVEIDDINENLININLTYNVLKDEDTTNQLKVELSTS